MTASIILPPIVNAVRARLITNSSEPEVPTSERETDARTALTRGLCDYIEQLSITTLDARVLRLQRVKESWAEPEERVVYPYAVVSVISGDYDASKFTPSVSSNNRLKLPDGRFIVSPCDYVAEMQLDIWSTDPVERMALAAMLEDALLAPVDFMYGFRLELPYYFNQRATYTVTAQTYLDAADEAMRRYRVARFNVTGVVPVNRLVNYPVLSDIRLRLEVVVEGQ